MTDKAQIRAPAIVLAVVLMVALGFVAQRFMNRDTPPASNALTLIEPPQLLDDFSLTGSDGKPFDRERLRGRWTFLFFGYTHCPDICPAAMLTLKQLRGMIGGRENGVQFVLISVDPERDAPAKLGEYVRYFDAEFIGATGPHENLARLTKPIGVYYARTGAGDNYQVNHSSALFLVGPDMSLRALLPQPHVPEQMAAAFTHLRQR